MTSSIVVGADRPPTNTFFVRVTIFGCARLGKAILGSIYPHTPMTPYIYIHIIIMHHERKKITAQITLARKHKQIHDITDTHTHTHKNNFKIIIIFSKIKNNEKQEK